MKSLKNIKKSVMEIAQLLAQDEEIVKLLHNDEPTALNDAVPSVDLNTLIQEHYICICAPVEDGIKDQWKNTFLTVLLDNGFFGRSDDNTSITIKIYVSTDEQHLLLIDNKNRLFELMERVIDDLDNRKLSSAGTITVNSFNHTMLSEFRFAYVISLSFNEQVTRKVEI